MLVSHDEIKKVSAQELEELIASAVGQKLRVDVHCRITAIDFSSTHSVRLDLSISDADPFAGVAE
jgi:hypothetical protein